MIPSPAYPTTCRRSLLIALWTIDRWWDYLRSKFSNILGLLGQRQVMG
jgi:hypothetical protein